MTTFYLIRHGQSDKTPGDPGLNQSGLRQARITAQHLTKLQVDAVYTSPLARARETAEEIVAVLGLPLIEDESLRERANFGDFPAQTFEQFVAMWQRCDRERDHVPEVGLAAQANGERLEKWLRSVHDQFPRGIVVGVSHGGTITDFLLNTFSVEELERRQPNFRQDFGNCSLTVLVFEGSHFRLDGLAVVDHLV